MKCTRCEDIGWVCENHDDKPWHVGRGGCMCGAGAPCPACNNADNPPRDPSGFERVETATPMNVIGIGLQPISKQAQEYLLLAKEAEAKAKATTNLVARNNRRELAEIGGLR